MSSIPQPFAEDLFWGLTACCLKALQEVQRYRRQTIQLSRGIEHGSFFFLSLKQNALQQPSCHLAIQPWNQRSDALHRQRGYFSESTWLHFKRMTNTWTRPQLAPSPFSVWPWKPTTCNNPQPSLHHHQFPQRRSPLICSVSSSERTVKGNSLPRRPGVFPLTWGSWNLSFLWEFTPFVSLALRRERKPQRAWED